MCVTFGRGCMFAQRRNLIPVPAANERWSQGLCEQLSWFEPLAYYNHSERACSEVFVWDH